MTGFAVLGTLEIRHDGRRWVPGPPQLRQALGLLLVRANRPVPMRDLAEELTGHRGHDAVDETEHVVGMLREMIVREGLTGAGAGPLLVSRPTSQRLQVSAEQLDGLQFERLARQGQLYLEKGRYRAAAQRLRHALQLWRGPALLNIAHGHLIGAEVSHLEQRHSDVLKMRIQADFNLGQHDELVAELEHLIANRPLDPWFSNRLIEALNRSGRRVEAMHAYLDHRAVPSMTQRPRSDEDRAPAVGDFETRSRWS